MFFSLLLLYLPSYQLVSTTTITLCSVERCSWIYHLYQSDSTCNAAAYLLLRNPQSGKISLILVNGPNSHNPTGLKHVQQFHFHKWARHHHLCSWPWKPPLASYASNGKLVDIISTISVTPSTPDKITRFIISHSYTFTKFYFYWDGAGKAVCGYGQDLIR